MSSLQILRSYILLARDFFIGFSYLLIARLLPELHPDHKDLTGKTAIVTGANSGVGYGMALSLAQQNATVILACRNSTKAAKAREAILSTCPGAKVDILILDTSSFESVRSFAKACMKKYAAIDILVHNAGISAPPDDRDFSQDGFEIMYQTNFLSSFLLTHLLESQLSVTARVIFTASIGSYASWIKATFSLSKRTNEIESNFHDLRIAKKSLSRYNQGKVMQAAFAKMLQSRFDAVTDNRRLAFSFEPGLVQTSIFSGRVDPFWVDPVFWVLSAIMPYAGISTSQGAATGVHLATSDEEVVLANRGRYFDRLSPRVHWIDVMTAEKLDKLWIRWCADCEISWI